MRIFKSSFWRRTFLWLFWALFLSGLTGCGKTGSIKEGDCKCTVTFVNIPKEFSMLEENVKDNFAIHLTLRNITNEKLYQVTLNQENDFEQELFLHPGTYQVYTLYASDSGYSGIEVAADAESVELSSDRNAFLSVTVDNTDEFTKHWMSVQPVPEILLADKYSGLIQINRQVTDIRDILSQLDLEYEGQVSGYKKLELIDGELGVAVTLLNTTENPAEWKDCEVIGIRVFKNHVVFPEGVTLGMAVNKVCHRTEGVYGEPDAFTGSLLYGWSLDSTTAVYRDPVSGNRITLELAANGSAISSITYELAQFE
ncbi:MAG: hypothetical protein NC081_11600 [Roseburia sp.]|nr:hypothetical protein [Roseburia sp.]